MGRLREVIVDKSQAEGALLVGNSVAHVWRDGKMTDEVQGNAFDVAFPKMGYADARVIVEDTTKPLLFPENEEVPVGTQVCFENLKLRAYSGKNGLGLTATADEEKLASPAARPGRPAAEKND